ncbi:unnamed protein product [Ostreobium quekettii]|uniref:SPARK domain-containing protein n=1 Tax=Ostreobium quekettii TaxID=121088 RepID=A0A8S1J3U4_9CHLO|nr:unnamed protein product [Ostreobium quekettii]
MLPVLPSNCNDAALLQKDKCSQTVFQCVQLSHSWLNWMSYNVLTPNIGLHGAADGATPSTPEEIAGYLQCCKDAGELASLAAAIAACSELANKCPAPPPMDNSIVPFSTGSSFVPTPAEELLKMALAEACVVSVQESCKSIARGLTQDSVFTTIYNTSCADTLNFGPAVPVIGCENLTVASTLFETAVADICETEVDLEDVMASLQEGMEEDGGR